MAEKIELTIDSVNVSATKGVTVLEAARGAGLYIPTLCHHPDLEPYGGCRLCVVEIEKMRGLPTSCTTPATEGMVVRTNTPQVQTLRQDVLKLILAEHPNACLTCHRRVRCGPNDICLRHVGVTERCVTCVQNRDCELQRLVDYVGISDRNLEDYFRDLPVDDRDPLIERNYNLCVLCGRCVQMCRDMRGIGMYSFINRGIQTIVGTAFNEPLKEAGCQFCGACVEVCPVGALVDKAKRQKPALGREAVIVPCHDACPGGINVPLYVYLAGGRQIPGLHRRRPGEGPLPRGSGEGLYPPLRGSLPPRLPQRADFHQVPQALRGGPR
ncbi:MAG: 2Fe-2S iron-sulfur cluster-binding protein [Chloroflexota bacterium]